MDFLLRKCEGGSSAFRIVGFGDVGARLIVIGVFILFVVGERRVRRVNFATAALVFHIL